MDPLPYVLANSALTLIDHQPREGHRAAAAHSALTRRVGQPGALDARTADEWAGPTATLYNDLNNATPITGRTTLPTLPFRNRYRDCFPVKHLDELGQVPGSGVAVLRSGSSRCCPRTRDAKSIRSVTIGRS